MLRKPIVTTVAVAVAIGLVAAALSHFRPAHNKGEGNEDVRLIASSTNLNFRSGPGSCVIDDYTTSKARYREIACLVEGPTSSAVIVAAAPTALWDQQAVTLERAVSRFVA